MCPGSCSSHSLVKCGPVRIDYDSFGTLNLMVFGTLNLGPFHIDFDGFGTLEFSVDSS